jgi:predicted dehydrogenase
MRMNIALVGCGAIARNHVKAVLRTGNAHLVAVCDTVEKSAAQMAAEWKIPHYYASLSDMLKNEDLSIVSILTPVKTHAPLAVEAINHGTNVLLEKPLTMTIQEADQVLESLKKNRGVKLTVNYTMLMSKVMKKALTLARNGQLGEILGIDIKFLHTRDDSMTSDMNHWSHRLPGGRFGEMLSHPVYVIQAILGDNLSVENVQTAKRGNYSWMPHDELYAMLRGGDGLATIHVSFNCPRPMVQVSIYGTERILLVNTLDQTLIELGARAVGKTEAAKDTLRLSEKLLAYAAKNAATYLFRESGQTAFEMAYESLIDSIRYDRPPLVTPEMAYHTVEIVDRICKSL